MPPPKTSGRRPLLSVLGGGTRPSLAWHKAVVVAVVCVLLAVLAGCGESEGVAEGATVTAYVVEPLCAEAERELERQRGGAGELRVRAVCLPSPRSSQRLDLSAIGANARSATEDSTAVAYLEARDHPANRFSEPILETAEIAGIYESSGKAAMRNLLRAIESSDSGSLRESVGETLE